MTVDIHALELSMLLLLLFVIGLAVLARRIEQPYPIVFVLGGLVLSFLPSIPHATLHPDFVFLVVLPPLLFAAAHNSSWRDFRENIFRILMLAFGLVAFTVLGVGFAAHFFFPQLTWRTGLVLGAVVSTTDAIAATSIARKLGISSRIVDILEGESLINDASGLLALSFTVDIIMTGHAPSVGAAFGQLLLLSLGGVAVGLAIAWLHSRIIQRIEAPSIELTITLITPYIVYLTAERLHTSGVIATVVCGLYLGHRQGQLLSLGARLESPGIWNTVDFILNGLVFLLLGLQISSILASTEGMQLSQLIAGGVMVSIIVILLRFAWVIPGAWASQKVQQICFKQPQVAINRKEAFIIAWGGMRGVIALAAALSLPETLRDDTTPFPERNIIIFFTFCVILVTLVFQGLSLPAIIRKLGMAAQETAHDHEEHLAREQMIDNAIAYLAKEKQQASAEKEIYDVLEKAYRRRLALVQHPGEDVQEDVSAQARRYLEIARAARNVERTTAANLLEKNEINDSVYQKLILDIDLLDARFSTPRS